MSKKQKKIFIITFIIVGIILVLSFLWFNRGDKNTPTEEAPWYQQFNPFGSSENIDQPGIDGGVDIGGGEEEITTRSRFFQITDFAVAGVTYTEERTLIEDSVKPKEIQVKIDPNTKEGRIKIQGILNKSLALAKPIIENGIIDQPTIEALKLFQKDKGISVTGKLDAATINYFTETKIEPGVAVYENLPAIRYVERKNGHLYKMLLKDKNSEKVSNSTIPTIYEAYFNKDGNTTIYRYLTNNDVISTFLASLGKPAGEYLPTNIVDLSVSDDKNRFFYLVKSGNSVTGFVQNFETGAKQNVFSHQLTEWLPSWDSKGNLYLSTKPSYVTTGNLYILKQNNKTLSKIIGGINGLTAKVSPDGSRVLYSVTTNKGPRLMIHIIEGRKTIDLDTYGLADKCIWSKDSINIFCSIPKTVKGNQYPDVWYQGRVSFEDFFIKIDTNENEIYTLADSTQETPVDATNLVLDRDENNLFFINKKDYTLWGFDVR